MNHLSHWYRNRLYCLPSNTQTLRLRLGPPQLDSLQNKNNLSQLAVLIEKGRIADTTYRIALADARYFLCFIVERQMTASQNSLFPCRDPDPHLVYGCADRHRDSHTDRHTHTHTRTHARTRTHRLTDRLTDRQTHTQTHRQTETHRPRFICSNRPHLCTACMRCGQQTSFLKEIWKQVGSKGGIFHWRKLTVTPASREHCIRQPAFHLCAFAIVHH